MSFYKHVSGTGHNIVRQIVVATNDFGTVGRRIGDVLAWIPGNSGKLCGVEAKPMLSICAVFQGGLAHTLLMNTATATSTQIGTQNHLRTPGRKSTRSL